MNSSFRLTTKLGRTWHRRRTPSPLGLHGRGNVLIPSVRFMGGRKKEGDQKKVSRKPLHWSKRCDEKEIERRLQEVNEELEEAEKEPFGKYRGKRALQVIIKKSQKKKRYINTQIAMARINELICSRYALMNGKEFFYQMCSRAHGEALLGPKGYVEAVHAKEIVKQQWRYGQSSELEQARLKYEVKAQERRRTQELQAEAEKRRQHHDEKMSHRIDLNRRKSCK